MKQLKLCNGIVWVVFAGVLVCFAGLSGCAQKMTDGQEAPLRNASDATRVHDGSTVHTPVNHEPQTIDGPAEDQPIVRADEAGPTTPTPAFPRKSRFNRTNWDTSDE